ncbi:MAG TPA: MG2 domain-containing protein [Chryseolinea sp.]
MQNISWKKVAIGIVTVVVLAAGVFYAIKSKGTKPAQAFVNPAFGEYISSYTAGVVGSGSTFRIILAADAVDSLAVGQETSVNLFSLSPSVKGKTTWLDRRTVEFKPDARLTSGQTYEVSFALSRLVEVPQELKTFVYSFQVIPQNFEVSIENVKPYVKTELKRQRVEGTLVTADVADAAAVEKIMEASQEGKALKVTWTHTAEGKQHPFVIEDVSRKETASVVKLALDGQPLGISQGDTREVEIPALGDFKVMNVRVEQSSTQHVVIQFSDPLNEKQNLDGLVSLNDVGTLDFDIKDNEIRVYPPVRQAGSKTLKLEAGIRNVLDYKMKQDTTVDVVFEQLNPAVRFTGKGSILPGTDGLIMPFEAVNLKSVDVEIVKIYEKNVLQFFQVNDYEGSQELQRVGRPMLRKTISLENAGVTDLGKWNRFTLDLSKMINTEPGAIYQVRIGFKRSYLAYVCEGGEETNSANDMQGVGDEDWEAQYGDENSYWDSYEEYYYEEDYDWNQRDNPCNSSYYTGDKTIRRNVLASDLGLLAKRGSDGNTTILVSDLKTTQPLSGVILELYDYQQMSIGTATSGSDGKAVIKSKETPFVLLARNGAQRGYLKMQDGESLSISNFDVGGERVSKGLKGLLYGERGVWRPGDSLYLTFILEDKMKLLPATHPVVLELQNPQGQVTNRLVRSTGENGFYSFATNTAADAPTGNWTARVKVGGAEFSQPIKIETVKPNRLKINLDFGVEKITAGSSNVSGKLNVKWLHGAPGRNLRAEFEVLLTKAETKFQRYPDFTFEDPSRGFSSEAKPIFEGNTDDEGNAVVNTTLEPSENAPGMLNAVFRGKVYEESGNFSIDRFSIPYYPYSSFTGIRLPPGDKARGMLLTDTTHRVDVVTVDADGKPVSHDGIEMSLYKLNWVWWWSSEGSNADYMSSTTTQAMATGTIRTVNGKGAWTFKVKYPEWGRFYVKAYDPVSGHTTGKVVYIDWPGWAGRSRGGNEGATMLSFSSDKPSYTIGEKATLTIPGSDQARALVSIENGSSVLQTYWVETKKGDTPFSFEITKEMTPNIFAHVTLVQPHAQTSNDLPMRLYGVIPIGVEDAQTHLDPVLAMPDVLEPGKEVTIKVSEKTNRKMTYTLAVVDEGLLDLTRFKTPDAWSRFYAREALGVKTWDVYDDVMGAFGSRIERLLAIGGDMEGAGKEDDAKANRFKPVVKFMGPFTLSGGSQEHKFIMPQYIGSVKTMLVAGYEGAYGKAEKATPVRKPLMVLATLPRVLGPEEKLKLPITLFTMEKSIRNIKITVKASGPLQVANPTQSVTMAGADMTVDFDLTVKSATGVGKVEVTASSGNYSATDVIEIDVRNPNPPMFKASDALVDAGKTWSGKVEMVGMAGTNSAVLELSSLPPINLGQRLKYLLQYPYGCVEQTTSAVFPQLYLDQVKTLTDAEKAYIQNNVKAGIERLKSFVTSDGGFGYWPGDQNSESWSSTYAGHFLLEAEAKGYFVPGEMIKRWKKHQRNKAQGWRKNQDGYYSGELLQAYRLYALALAGEPEMGAMNRLRETEKLDVTSRWMLAAAYAKAGQPEAARKMIATLPVTVKPYQEMSYSYGSDLRDQAIILETLLLLNERVKAFERVKEISAGLSRESYWMSTQTVAWCLKSVGAFAGSEKRGPLKFSYTYNGKTVEAQTDLTVAQVQLPVDGIKSRAINVVSASKGTLFVRLISEGTPARGLEEESESNLSLTVTYSNTDGGAIDPSHLEQGTEFIASVTVSNPGLRGPYYNLALNQIFPSGWEINNLRLDEAEDRLKSSRPTYQDIRDDRVYTYFDLAQGQSKTFQVLLTASYGGTYYLPAVTCEAMYDRSVYSRKKGMEVEVTKRITQ